MTDCVRCGHPVADTGYACHACTGHLVTQLGDVAYHAGETAITIARLDRHGDSGHTSAEKPLPFDWDASDAAWVVHNTIATWARHVSETRGAPIEPLPPLIGPCCRPRHPPGSFGADRCPHDSCAQIRVDRHGEHPTALAARWLAGQLGWLRMRPEAAEAYDELLHAAWLLRTTVDNPGVRWYAGPCHADPVTLGEGERCQAQLYAAPGAGRVRCPECGTIHDAGQRRAWLLDEARDQLLHAGWMASALSALGQQVTAAQIRGYAHRGRILAHGEDELGRPVYRVGDVLYLVENPRRVA